MESPQSRLTPHARPISSSASSGVGAATAHVDGIGAPTSVDSVAVHGWLMNVPGYGENTSTCNSNNSNVEEIENKSNRLLFDERRRNHRSASISSLGSTDSANLDDLIRNNCVAQVDEETDLPDLADLDLDDSADDFWKMNDTLANGRPMNPTTTLSADRDHELLSINTPLDEQELVKMAAGDDKLLSWSPEAQVTTAQNKLMASKLRVTSSGYGIPSPGHRFERQRSSSLSSENSLTSESTITTSGNTSQYAHYGMTPVLYPSESTSASNTSRSPSRLSDYSATSSQTSHTSAIPRPQSKSHAASSSHNTTTTTTNTRRLSDKLSSDTLGSSSRIATGSRINPNQSRLAKRATHVPLPSTRTTPPTVIATTSRSTGLSDTSRFSSTTGSNNNNNMNRPASRVGARRLRSSHIPSPHTRNVTSPEPPSSADSCIPTRGGYRPMSPSYAGNSRTSGIRSPTPTNGSRHRLVNNKKDESRIARPASPAISGISRLVKPKRTA